MGFADQMSVVQYLIEYFMAPVNYTDILPRLIPLILGVLVLEVYFEKTNPGRMERADPIGNALLWLSTGIALLVKPGAQGKELMAVLFIVSMGAITLTLEFLEHWREKLKIFHSFIVPVYSIAYLTVVLVGTPLTINSNSIKAALIFMAMDVVIFTFWKKIVPVPNK